MPAWAIATERHLSAFLWATITSILLIASCEAGADDDKPKWYLLEQCLVSNGVSKSELVKRDGDCPARYADSNFQYQQCCGHKAPMAYLITTNVSHIQSAIVCARKHGIRVVPKGGGHSMGKFGFGDSDSLVLDLKPMKQVHIDPVARTVDAGPGVLIGPLAYQLYHEGKFGIPVGECVIIGITFALGGGYSQFSRLHGMASDNLVELEMIDAKGNLLVANKNTHSDLFWGLRGAGWGSFGVVTRYKFKLFDAPHAVVKGTNNYNITEFPAVFDAYQRYLVSTPARNISVFMRMTSIKVTMHIFQHLTQEEATSIGDTEVREILRTKFPIPKRKTTLDRLTVPEFILQVGYENALGKDNITNVTQLGNLTGYDFSSRNVAYKTKSMLIPVSTAPIPYTAVLKMYELIKARPISNTSLAFRSYGGKINSVPSNMTAFVHRSILYEMVASFLGRKGMERDSPGVKWVMSFYNTTKQLMGHKEGFQNHLDPYEGDGYLKRYYGENVKRLVQVKAKYDPDNVFYHPQSIPVRLAG